MVPFNFNKIVLTVVLLVGWGECGEEGAPGHSYALPSVAKVTYPAPTLTKSVQTYSAPSIEKTTTITRTITAPLNAPHFNTVYYSAPSQHQGQQHVGQVLLAAPAGVPGNHQILESVPYSHQPYHAPAYLLNNNFLYTPQQLSRPAYPDPRPQLGASYHAPHAPIYSAPIYNAPTYSAPPSGHQIGGHGIPQHIQHPDFQYTPVPALHKTPLYAH